ncbi:trypsin-like peptidase domain-containing protein [Actinomadura graeca]|uniref:Trypsin-like peptidase domain-containing protein n=1 Tax=Actinomadura graeca TaxID=2750812 RepID=A0ABX8R6N9_9ACTN|nr:trypsin-like peptidase domain-containing protein [Actinomadura graeca]QXJ26089.1 trypsin-like peptidase domain-containing protein [Actinomadura graeca]
MGRTRNVRMGAAALAGVLALGGCSDGDAGAARGRAPTPNGGATQLQGQYEQVVAAVLPSVVKIETDQGEGSGVVFDGEGHVVTNAHVVAGARRIQVTASSGGAALKAAPVGAFAADDLAVVKVEGGALRPASFGDSAKIEVGRIVLAMGNPLGLAGSVTNGIVSALNRTVSTKQEGDFPGATIADAVQTSAAINPGNSGGALVGLDGQVIGIPTAAASDPQMGGAAIGIGFATPSNTVKRIVPQLIRDGRVTDSGRAAIGATVRTVVGPSGQGGGVAIVEVAPGGGAAKAGVRPGDLILSANGTATPDQTALSGVLAGLKPGGTVTLQIQRPDGSKETLGVTLGELPAD